MPKYRFKWDNLSEDLLMALAGGVSNDGVAVAKLTDEFGARPTERLVEKTWPVLLDVWLSSDDESALEMAALLASRGVGDKHIDHTTRSGALEYLRSCRNTSGLRSVVVDRLIAVGEPQPPLRAPAEPEDLTPPEGKALWEGVDPGLRAIQALYDGLAVDPEWCIPRERGFTWWSYRLAQHIDADLPAAGPDGAMGSCIRVRTDLVTQVPKGDPALGLASLVNMQSTLSALVWDEGRQALNDNLTSIVYDDTVETWSRLLVAAAILQNTAAHSHAQAIADATSGRTAETNHPTSGVRPTMDEMLNAPAQVIVPMGSEPSRFRGQLVAGLGQYLPFPGSFDADGGTVEVPFSNDMPAAIAMPARQPLGTSLLRIETTRPHPQYGNGVLMLLTLPVSMERHEAEQWSNYLNLLEASRPTGTNLLGAWCADPRDDESVPVSFTAFIPNALASPGLLENMSIYAATRSVWARGILFT